MRPYPRLSRSQVIARLKAHATEHGYVANVSLHAHDRVLLRSIPLHFVGVAAAREAAAVPGPPYRKPRAKTGPKPGGPFGRRDPLWSKQRVLDELRQRHRAGKSTAYADLVKAGLLSLFAAARTYAGGLHRARKLAGIPEPTRRPSRRRYDENSVITEITARSRTGKPLAASLAPPRLVAAGRWHFGTWSRALHAAGVDPEAVRVPRRTKYSRQYIIQRLREAANAGSDLRAVTLAKQIKLEAVRREFGTLRAALHAAGLVSHLQRRKHGLQKWSRERVIEVLRERAARKVYTLTPGLHRVVQLYFGGADAARNAAGVPSPLDIRQSRRTRVADARRDRSRNAVRVMTPRSRRGRRGLLQAQQ